jgi:hypothetical protein
LDNPITCELTSCEGSEMLDDDFNIIFEPFLQAPTHHFDDILQM